MDHTLIHFDQVLGNSNCPVDPDGMHTVSDANGDMCKEQVPENR